jgi:mono/diheme cytochrome c family protein
MKANLVAIMLALTLGGCDVSMTQQPRYNTYAPSRIWSDGASARPLPDNTVAQGDLARHQAETVPPPADLTLLRRGQERFGIDCAPCHGLTGEGDGIIVAHGFPRPPSYQEPRLLSAPAQHFYDVITLGHGVMYSYASRVEPSDRWAIVAYVRALQLTRHASLADAPEAAERLQ